MLVSKNATVNDIEYLGCPDLSKRTVIMLITRLAETAPSVGEQK